MSIPLYWFQTEAVNQIESSWSKGNRSVLISIPTGGGKTIIFSHMLKTKLINSQGRGLVLAHTDSLLNQAEEKLSFVWTGVDIGRVQGGVYEYDKKITISSVQTLTGRLKELQESCKTYGNIEFVVFDEAHHSYASTWQNVYHFLKEKCNPLILGVTATPMRSKKTEKLADLFDDMPYSISIFQLIQEGFLSPIMGYNIATSLNLEGVHIKHGDYKTNELSQRVQNSNLNKTVVKAWSENARKRKAICFAVDIPHVEALEREFALAGARVKGIQGNLTKKEQRNIISNFTKGNYDVLINCMLLTEGFDEPSIDCVLMARPTTSRILYVQMLGRGLRLYPNKKDCLLLDFTSNSSKNSLVTLQDLLGFYGLKGVEKIYKSRNKSNVDDVGDIIPLKINADTIPDYKHVDDIGEELETSLIASEVDIFDINKFSWGNIDESMFVAVRYQLSLAIIAVQNRKFQPFLIYSVKDGSWVCPLSEPVSKEFAHAIANVYLFDFGNRKLSLNSSSWRDESPTPSQRELLPKLLDHYNKTRQNEQISISSIPETKGNYSNMITALFSIKHINGNTKRITKDEAMLLLREMIIQEVVVKTENPKETEQKDIKLQITGDYSQDDYDTLMNICVDLSKTNNSDFAVTFLTSNPIAIDGNTIKVCRKAYPKYNLTDKQKGFLMGKISLVFRLYFRNKRFEIVDTDVSRDSQSLHKNNRKSEDSLYAYV